MAFGIFRKAARAVGNDTPAIADAKADDPRGRNAWLEAAIEMAPVAIAVYDDSNVLRVHNAAYQKVYANIWRDLPSPVTYPSLVRANLVKSGFKGDLEAEVAKRVQLQREADGRPEERSYSDGTWRRVSKVRVGGAVIGYALDVTEVRTREEELNRSKQELSRIALETVPQAMAGFSAVASEVIAATEDVKELIGESSQRAIATGAAAEELAVTINHVAATMKDTADGAMESSRDANMMNTQIERLGEALNKVNAFADMIRGIAAQTNLLALNATIEAARAGEAGRGFSVVAAEVKALSKQTGDATIEITTQVSAVETLMADARGITAKIAAALLTITENAAGVASAVQQQRDAAQSVSSHMADIITRSSVTSDAADRALRESADMEASARQLEATVKAALSKVA